MLSTKMPKLGGKVIRPSRRSLGTVSFPIFKSWAAKRFDPGCRVLDARTFSVSLYFSICVFQSREHFKLARYWSMSCPLGTTGSVCRKSPPQNHQDASKNHVVVTTVSQSPVNGFHVFLLGHRDLVPQNGIRMTQHLANGGIFFDQSSIFLVPFELKWNVEHFMSCSTTLSAQIWLVSTIWAVKKTATEKN